MRKILITVPHKKTKGGINSFYAATKPYYTSAIKYITRGSPSYPYHAGIVLQLIRLFSDYCHFILVLISGRFPIIHINLTLDKRGLYRDSIYIALAALKIKSKILVFIHGWDSDYVSTLNQRQINRIGRIFCKADSIVVLSIEFKHQLEEWGYKKPIYVLTTAVNPILINTLSMADVLNKNHPDKFILLFLARLEKEKGIHLALDVFKKLKYSYPHFKFIIAGDGTELEAIKLRVINENIQDVSILGHISGEKMKACFLDADIYFFPTYYKEGLPTSVLEAFCFGLPVVTRPVAGIKDIFENEKNGILINSLDDQEFTDAIIRLYLDKALRSEIITYNFHKGHREYSGDIVAGKLESIYSTLYA